MLLCAMCGGARANPVHADIAAGVKADEVPPQLLEKVRLVYPVEALESGRHGTVVLRVVVAPTGGVSSVDVVSGDAIFHAAALEAATLFRFAPATRAGEPVTGVLRVSLHFAPPDPEDTDDEVALEVVVISESTSAQNTRPEAVLGTRELDRSAGRGVAELVSEVPGVIAASGTADVAKPIIRGQTERRLLILQDGVRLEVQKWGVDHAPEVDPFAAGEVRVVRGVAGMQFGPDAMGGVILVNPPALRDTPGVGGRARMGFATNGRAPYGALRLDVVPAKLPALSLRAEGSYRRAAAMESPGYILGNTASEHWSAGATAGYRWAGGALRARWHRVSQRSGMFYGIRSDSPSSFQEGLVLDRPATADQWTVSYTIDRPYQESTHDVASVHADIEAGEVGDLQVVYAYQHNRRFEYEQVRRSEVAGPQYDFTLRTHTLDVTLDHHSVEAAGGHLEGSAGVSGQFQENVYRGWSLIPNYRDFSVGVFALERLVWTRGAVELGGRYDHLNRNTFVFLDDYGKHLSRGTLNASLCEERETVARCPSSWHTGSVALGGVVRAVPDILELKFDLSSASRFPDVDELYLTGAAPSLPVYALGDPLLGVETAWSLAHTIGLKLPWVEAEASGYGALVDNYIYFAPQRGPSGALAYDVTIEGTYPRFSFRSVDAWTAGLDGALSLGPQYWLGLDVSGSLVRAVERETGSTIVGTPADRMRATLVGRPPGFKALEDPYIGARVDVVGRQSRVDPADDFAPPPDSYVLLGLSAGVAVVMGSTRWRIDLEANNMLNQRYREYTSLLRYFADQPGRDVRVRVALDF
ncbi:MAG: TonB family protein [Myxococcota bacterium]